MYYPEIELPDWQALAIDGLMQILFKIDHRWTFNFLENNSSNPLGRGYRSTSFSSPVSGRKAEIFLRKKSYGWIVTGGEVRYSGKSGKSIVRFFRLRCEEEKIEVMEFKRGEERDLSMFLRQWEKMKYSSSED